MLIVLVHLRSPIADASETPAPNSVIPNGDLSRGTDDAPESWDTQIYKPNVTSFRWNHAAGAPANLEILSVEANDARWEQNVRLAPGWYYFTAELRTEDVGSSGTGGCLSLIDHGVFLSHELSGTTDWQKVGFYLKADEKNDTADLACRLGGFGALNGGRLFCRRFNLSKITGPPADGNPRYDLAVIRGDIAPTSPSIESSKWPTLFMEIVCAVMLIALIRRPRFSMALGWLRASLESERAESSSPVNSSVLATQSSRFIDKWGATFASIAGVVALVFLAIHRLDGTFYAVDLSAAISGIRPLLPITGVAASKLWSFWALCSLILAALILQAAPELDILDALLSGVSGVWIIAYLVGQALGPIGLFRPLAIWVLVGAGIVQIARRPPAISFRAIRPGEKIALLALGLLVIGMLPLQLGSPVAPYMDVLSYPASVERILAFKVYLPFDNDPFGCWGARAQTPALELLCAALALGADVKQGVLAHSALMVPMTTLIIFATYRLGLSLAGDSLGGIATLLLFFTNMFRRLPGMRGTAVDFALVALGLAFFFDRRRSRTLIALGAILLGTSVAGHAIDGASAMVIAGLGSLPFLLDRDFERFRVNILCLFGAALFAWPEVMIGLGKPVIYPVLPIIQIAGIGVIVAGVRGLMQREVSTAESSRLTTGPYIILPAISVIYIYFATRGWIFAELLQEFPILSLFAVFGLILWVAYTPPRLSTGSIIVVIALSEAAVYLALGKLMTSTGGDVFRSGFADIGLKLEQYWCPYFMVFPAAVPFALLYQQWRKGRPLILFGLLTLLIYPWYERLHVDYDYNEHSIAENWGIDLGTAAGGFWITTPDSRWTLDSSGFALVDFLRSEQAKGRITARTHVLHLAHDVTPLGEFNRFSVFTGINDDPVVYEIPNTDIVYGYLAGSRVRKMNDLAEAFAERPPYILEQVSPLPGIPDHPEGYDEVFHQGMLRLFRRNGG
jgi:hypothetical protein